MFFKCSGVKTTPALFSTFFSYYKLYKTYTKGSKSRKPEFTHLGKKVVQKYVFVMFTLFRGWGRPGAISTFCTNRLFPIFNSQGILNQNKPQFIHFLICSPLPTIIFLGGLPVRDKTAAKNNGVRTNLGTIVFRVFCFLPGFLMDPEQIGIGTF